MAKKQRGSKLRWRAPAAMPLAHYVPAAKKHINQIVDFLY
jgi:hypothetical protein